MSETKAKPTWRELLDQHQPLVLPGAYDGISAHLIKQAGFPAYFIGGFPVIGSRYGLPDIGLVGLGELSQSIRDIMRCSDLPVLVDIDDGYGDVKNVTRTMNIYEEMGVSAVHIEDQLAPKRCGHMAGKVLISTQEMEDKIRAAAAARNNKDLFIIARTDARDVVDLDEALRRGERYVEAGADGLFIESPRTVEELQKVADTFKDVPLFANMLANGVTPILSNKELGEMGFDMVVHGINLCFKATEVMQQTLQKIKNDQLDPNDAGIPFEEYKTLVGFNEWAEVDENFRTTA